MSGMNAITGRRVEGIDHLRQSLRILLTTAIGARVMRRHVGASVPALLDNPINGEFIAEIYSAVVVAIFTFEPRFRLSSVAVADITEGEITLDLEGEYLVSGESIRLEGLKIA